MEQVLLSIINFFFSIPKSILIQSFKPKNFIFLKPFLKDVDTFFKSQKI